MLDHPLNPRIPAILLGSDNQEFATGEAVLDSSGKVAAFYVSNECAKHRNIRRVIGGTLKMKGHPDRCIKEIGECQKTSVNHWDVLLW